MSKFKAGDWVKDTKLCRYHIAEVKYPLYVIDNVIYPLKKDMTRAAFN